MIKPIRTQFNQVTREFFCTYYIQKRAKAYCTYEQKVVLAEGIELRFYTDSTQGTLELIKYLTTAANIIDIIYQKCYYLPDSKYTENLPEFEQILFSAIIAGFAHQEICGESQKFFIEILWKLVLKSGVLDEFK